MKNPIRMIGSTVLVCEALVVFFAGLVAKNLSGLSAGTAVAGAGLLAVLLILAAGMMGRRAGVAVGTVLQVIVLATGFWVPLMFFLGGIFVVLWFIGLRIGARIEAERAAIDAAAEAGPHA